MQPRHPLLYASASQLATEFLTELIEAVLMVWLMAQARLETFSSQLGFAAVVGIVAAMTTNSPYWNWDGPRHIAGRRLLPPAATS